jgi:hypothetical protein
MKIKGLVFVSCLAAGSLITSPALSKRSKKTAGSSSQPQQTAVRTTQVTLGHRYQQNRQKRELAHRQHAILPWNALQWHPLLC